MKEKIIREIETAFGNERPGCCGGRFGESYQSFNVMTKELRATRSGCGSIFYLMLLHEFKTPINAIEGYTMLLREKNCLRDKEEI